MGVFPVSSLASLTGSGKLDSAFSWVSRPIWIMDPRSETEWGRSRGTRAEAASHSEQKVFGDVNSDSHCGECAYNSDCAKLNSPFKSV